MPRRTIARSPSLCAALGIATTVCVAAAFGWAAQNMVEGVPCEWGERLVDAKGAPAEETHGKAPPLTQYLEVQLYRRTGATFGTSRLRPFLNYTPASPPPVRTPPESIVRRGERAVLLPWIDGRAAWPDPTVGDARWIKSSGWPFRCFYCRLGRQNAPGNVTHTWSVRGGIILSNPTFPSWADWPPSFPRIIPLLPLWPELLGNIVVFSIGWAGTLFGLAAARASLRHRRGRCGGCGYQLEGLPPASPCPECGLVRE